MDAKISDIRLQGLQTVVNVQFLDEAKIVYERIFSLDEGQTIDDIKPDIKEALINVEKSVNQKKNLQGIVNTNIDLKGVKSVSEMKKSISPNLD